MGSAKGLTCVVLALVVVLLGGCGSAVDDRGADAESAIDVTPRLDHLATGDGRAWMVESVGIDELVDPSYDQGERYTSAHRVFEVAFDDGGNADPSDVTETEFPLPRTSIAAVVVADGRLVVAGEECIDGGIEESCMAHGVIRVLTDTGWETAVVQGTDGGSRFGQTTVSIQDVAGDELMLNVQSSNSGALDGGLRVGRFDLSTMTRTWTSQPTPANTSPCTVDGRHYAIETTGGWQTPIDAGEAPTPRDPVTTTMSLTEMQSDGSWAPVANGSFDGVRPRGEMLRCTDFGFSTSPIGSGRSVLGWTPQDGWVERDPTPEVLASSESLVGSLTRADGGPAVTTIDGEPVYEISPGEFVPLPIDTLDDTEFAWSGGDVVACDTSRRPFAGCTTFSLPSS